MSYYRPKLPPESIAWRDLIELGRELSPEEILGYLDDTIKIDWNNEEKTVTTESGRVKTLEQLLEVAEVDENIYDVERHIINSWEVTSWKKGYAETKTNWQVKAWMKNKFFDDIDQKWLDEHFTKLAKDLPKVQTEREATGKPLTCVIADLHAGGFTENMKMVPDYNLDVLMSKMSKLSENLRHLNRPVHLKILGDLIESFSGKNHKNTWKQIEQHGIKVMFTVTDILRKLLDNTPNIVDVDIISGNHDRISASNEDDTEGQVAYGVAELLKRSCDLPIRFDPLVLSAEHDGVNYIQLHGHLPIAKKNPAELVLDYGNQNMYNVVLTAHKHTEQVKKSTSRLRVHQVPSFVPANQYAEQLGAHSSTGFVLMESNEIGTVDVQTIGL